MEITGSLDCDTVLIGIEEVPVSCCKDKCYYDWTWTSKWRVLFTLFIYEGRFFCFLIIS